MTDILTQAETELNGSTPSAPRPKKGRIEKTRAAANNALNKTLGNARDAADRTAKAIENNPLPLLAGGLAIGALAGALIPRSKREVKLLAPVGERIRATTTGAVSAAKEAGTAELGALGLSKSALSDQAGKVVGNVLKALATAGNAAVTASKDAKPVSTKKTG